MVIFNVFKIFLDIYIKTTNRQSSASQNLEKLTHKLVDTLLESFIEYNPTRVRETLKFPWSRFNCSRSIWLKCHVPEDHTTNIQKK